MVIPVEYMQAGDFSEGFAWVEKNGKRGYIDKTGKEITSFQYDVTLSFGEGMAGVMKNEKVGFINTTGKEVIPCAYDNCRGFSQGLAAVQKGDKWGYIDKTGEEVIPFQYDDASSFSQGLARVKKGGKWGFIDKAGEAVIDFQYEDVGDFANGLAWVKQGGKYGFIDKTGELAIPCEFENVGYFSEGLAAVKQNGKWGYIDTTGKIVIPCKYDYAAPFSEGFAAVGMLYSPGSTSFKWGFIDKTGKEVITPTSHTMDGVEYAVTSAVTWGSVPTFKDGCASACRHFYNGDWPGGSAEDFYFALTVDAKVSNWAREQVDSAAVKGLMPDGLGDDFTAKITRAEFAALAVKLYEAMSGDTAPAPGESPFSDTTDPVVIQANALDIVKGKGGGKFAPEDLVTREEAAVMLSRVYTKLGGEVPTVTATTFADDGRVSNWAKSEVAFMAGKGIINGKGNNTFDPNGKTGNASIEESMVIALRMFEKLK